MIVLFFFFLILTNQVTNESTERLREFTIEECRIEAYRLQEKFQNKKKLLILTERQGVAKSRKI